MIPERHFQVIRLLPHLQHLDLQLESDGSWSESTLGPLKNMTALTSLSLTICEPKGPLLVSPLLAQLTQLQDLCLECEDPLYDDISQAHLMQTVSKLIGLNTLGLFHMVQNIPAELERLPSLTHLKLGGLFWDDPNFAIPPSFGMCIQLRRICLSLFLGVCHEAWQMICNSLLLLPRLDALDVMHVDLSKVQPSSWALPSTLTSLNLSFCKMRMFPAALCRLPQLQHLTVRDWDRDQDLQLASFPTGPYLRNLRCLNIHGLKFGTGPEALRDAVRLQKFSITSRRSLGPLWTNSVLQQLVPGGCSIVLIDGEDGQAGHLQT